MRLLLLAAAVALTFGCAAKQPLESDTQVEYMFPDRAWTAPTKAAPPPDPAKFDAAPIEEQARMNGDAYNRQTKQLGVCNANMEAIRLWEDQIRLESIQ